MSAHARRLMLGEAALLAAAAVLAALTGRASDWDAPVLLSLLLVAGMVSDLLRMRVKGMRISGDFVAVVIAAALMGPAPALTVAVVLTLVEQALARVALRDLVANLANFAAFAVAGGLLLRLVRDAGLQDAGGSGFALVVMCAFVAMNSLNFALAALHMRIAGGASILRMVRTLFIPVLPSQLAAATLAAGIVILYERVGLAAIAALALVLLTFQYLLREMLRSQERAEEVEARSRQLASLQVGVLTAMIQTLSLRDRMTARHCAAVARYAREIACEAGLDDSEQELVHTAGLLHDIGKFIFPDSILSGAGKLTDEEFEIVKRHPEQGARVVRKIDGYGPVADIILAHHERIDGRGYPRGLCGDEIPLLSRMISVADTYDVMTARDSYREPVSPDEAVAELRRVAGAQLDARLVEIFVALLERKGVAFRHADDADFEAELAFEARVGEHAAPRPVAA